MNRDKTVLFLCRKDDRSDYDTASSMTSGIRAHATSDVRYMGYDLEDIVFSYDGMRLQLTDGSLQKNITDFSAVFLLGWFKTKMLEDIALAVSHVAKNHTIPCLNTEAYYTRSRTKLSQYVMACIANVSVTPFVFSLNHEHLLAAVKQSVLRYPLIVKSVQASRGRDNYLVHSYEELETLLMNHAEVPFVVQHFVPNDGDYRLIVMGDKVTVAIHRQSQSASHLNNTSQGGRAELVDVASLDSVLIQDAIVIAKAVKREVAGIDIIIDNTTGAHYMLEINNMPQLSTGSKVDDKLRALDRYFSQIVEDANA